MTIAPFCVLAVVLAAVSAEPKSAQVQPVRFFVDPLGDDTWTGRQPEQTGDGTDGPFRSVVRAQRAIRELRQQGRLTTPVTVAIRGTHRLAEPVVFEPQDSGTKECPITYTAYPDDRPVLSGGRPIANWKKGEGKLWTAHIPQVKAGKWYFRQLFVNGRRAHRARSPNEGFFRVASLVNPRTNAKWNEGVDRFHFNPGDLCVWPDLRNVELVVFHSWNTSRVRIAVVDQKENLVRLTGPTHFRPLAWDPQQRYYVENVRHALDAPGEWFLDRGTGTLYYWPLPGEQMTEARVVAPVLHKLIQFAGDPDASRFVEHIRVVRLSLQHADWTLPETGYGDPQAAVTVPAVVSANGARHCTIERCEIAHVGTYGIWLARGCKDNRIVQNHFHDLGAGGVRLGQDKMAQADVAESTRNLVANNYIHDGGHVYAAGVGIWVAQSSHNTISHNEIHSFDYSGMSLGWNWNETSNRPHHNLVEHNHVHHVLRGVLSDGGGIYTLGTQTGTVIRNNVFHDIFPYMGSPAMAWGIYMDQGSNGLLIENNIVYNTFTGGIMNTGMRRNIIRNNIFAHSARQAVWRYNFQGNPPTSFERNIVYLTQGDLFHTDGGRDDTESKWDHNLFWRTDGKELLFYGNSFHQWQAQGMDRHSLVADPLFVDAAACDFTLAGDSPARKLGFEPIDVSNNGLQGPPEWVALPRQAKFAPTVLPPLPLPPPPIPVDDGFEEVPLGGSPKLARIYMTGDGSIRVTDETAASGRHALKFTDAPGLEHVWDPHMFYTPRFGEGKAQLSFDVRIEKGAIFDHEWRDAAAPYHVGPVLRINSDGALLANGKPLAKVPLAKWLHVEIACRLGKSAAASYDLTLILPGQDRQTFKQIACGSARFAQLEWLGFVSSASNKAVFYLDNMKLILAE